MKLINKRSSLWTFTNNLEFNIPDDRIERMNNTKYTYIKPQSITGYKENEDGIKKNATSEVLSAMLSQSMFGRTSGLIRLPHSGFSVKLKPIMPIDRTNFQHTIATNTIQLHRTLSGDLYSGVYVTIDEATIDLFVSHIEYTTLDLTKKANIRKYIRVKDLGIIRLALLDMMYPEGYNFNYICSEEIVTTIDGQTNKNMCGNISDNYLLKMSELLYTVGDLTASEYEQLMETKPNSIDVKSVIEYQSKFKYNEPTVVELDNMKYTIDPGVVEVYINKSKTWLKSNIIESPTFTNGEDIDGIKRLVELTKIGMYFYTLDKIENDYYVCESSKITIEHINILSTREDVSNLFITAAQRSLAHTCYIIGVPKYTCPSCLANKQNDENNEVVNDRDIFTNLNLLDLFP